MEMGSASLSFAVYDANGKGVVAKARKAEEDLLFSRQFGIKCGISGGWRKNVATAAFFVAREYFASLGLGQRYAVELHNSPMFGKPGEKSGLGSSSAATVAVVKALFASEGLDGNSEVAHKLCQYAYAIYSGKIGSGYDIACAWLGKGAYYERFAPSCIIIPEGSEKLGNALSSTLGAKWDGMKLAEAKVHPKYSVRFFNLGGGSTSTLGSLKAVIDYKEKDGNEYFRMIHAQDCFERNAILALERGESGKLRENVHGARELHRQLQEKVRNAGGRFDFIEPQPLSELIEFGESLGGVVAGRCPGAGGYDGLAFIVEEKKLDDGFEGKLEKKAAGLSLKANGVALRLA